jgi:hypothetical protein
MRGRAALATGRADPGPAPIAQLHAPALPCRQRGHRDGAGRKARFSGVFAKSAVTVRVSAREPTLIWLMAAVGNVALS